MNTNVLENIVYHFQATVAGFDFRGKVDGNSQQLVFQVDVFAVSTPTTRIVTFFR